MLISSLLELTPPLESSPTLNFIMDPNPDFTLEEDLCICRNFVLCYPKRGEERRRCGFVSTSYLSTLFENFCSETGNPNNRTYIMLYVRYGTIRDNVKEFMELVRIMGEIRLRGETDAEVLENSIQEWRRWKRSSFQYLPHFNILKDFYRTRRPGY